MDVMKLSMEQWLEIGLRAGYVSPPVCMNHDGFPTTITGGAISDVMVLIPDAN